MFRYCILRWWVRILTATFRFYRCLRLVRRPTHRKSARKIAVCSWGVLSKSVPQSAHAIREATAPTTIITDCQFSSDWTAVLRSAGGEDADRDPNKGHAAVRQLILVAVYGDHVTYDVETVGGGLIDALRLPAVSAQPAVRPIPTVPEGSRGRGDVIEWVPRECGTSDHFWRVLRFEDEQGERESRSLSNLRSYISILRSEVHWGVIRCADHHVGWDAEECSKDNDDRQSFEHTESRFVFHTRDEVKDA